MRWYLMLVMLLAVVCTGDQVHAQETFSKIKNLQQRTGHRQRREDRSLKTLALLQRRVPAVEFDEQPFEDVLDWFRAQGIKNIIVRWPRLKDYGDVDRMTPVSLQLHDMSLGELLEQVLDYVSQESAEEGRLHYQICKGILTISTREDFGSQLIVRTYHIEDLLQKLIFNDDSPVIDVAGGGGDSRGGGGSDSGGGRGPGGDGGGIIEGGGGEGNDYEANREEMVVRLVDFIHSIRPESWTENGGRGIVRVFQSRLVITQTIEIHEIIGGTVRLGVGRGRE